MNSVAIVVLNWNGIDDTEKCVQSLLQLDYADYKILIVDNGSKDDSKSRLAKLKDDHTDKVEVIYNSSNLGFAGGVNTGIRWAIENSVEYVALFNNDAIADTKWLQELTSSLKDGFGIVTGLLLHADGKTIDSTGDFYSKWGLPFPRNRGEAVVFAPSSGEVFGASGGATLYRTEIFNDIGLFDDDFFAYYEDVDISFRAQLADFRVAYNSEAIAYHKQGASSEKIPGFTVIQTFKNLPWLYIKNVPRGLLLSIGVRFIVAYTLMFIKAIKNGAGWPATKGLVLSIAKMPVKIKQRFEIQKSKKVSAQYIRNLLWNDLPPEQTGLRKFRRLFTRHD